MLYRVSRKLCISFFPILFALTICVTERSLMAQNQTNVQTQASSNQDASNPENWRHKPVPLDAHPDTLSPEARQERDKFWEKASPPPPPPGGFGSTLPIGGIRNDYGEIYAEPDAIWVVASVIAYDVHITSKGSIYTEIHLHVDKNVGPIHPDTPLAGTTIDLGIPGGSVVLSDGSIIETYTANYTDYVCSGHKYLLLLQKTDVSKPDFYFQGGGWDVSDGIARSVFSREAAIAKRGRSTVDGLSEADAIMRIEHLFSEKAGK